MRRLSSLSGEREGPTAPPFLASLRLRMAEAVQAGNWAVTPPAEQDRIDGIRVLRFAPKRRPRAVFVHFHGGGFRLGCPEAMGPYARRLADRCAVEVLCPAYRLAPEHPFPAGLNDGLAVIRALAAANDVSLIVAGDSAGGGLAASLTALLVANGTPPQGLVLHSPWLDLTVSAASYQTNAETDVLFSRDAAITAAELYLQDRSPSDPLASPMFAPLAGFPPTLITVGTGEVLLDDARRMRDRLQAAGADVRLVEVEGMDHVAVTRGVYLVGAAAAFGATADFLDCLLRPRSNG